MTLSREASTRPHGYGYGYGYGYGHGYGYGFDYCHGYGFDYGYYTQFLKKSCKNINIKVNMQLTCKNSILDI